MNERRVGIVVNGVTGRMGYRQHLVRSLLAIREQGGLPLADGTTDLARADPGRPQRGRSCAEIAERHGLTDWTTDLAAALARDDVEIYFDAQVTQQREKAIRAAIEAGKHIYTREAARREPATAAVDLARAGRAAGVKHGVVQDKLFLPGPAQAEAAGRRRLLRPDPVRPRRVRLLGLRGRLAGGPAPVAGTTGPRTAAASSLDMFPHWQYVLEQLFGPVTSVYCQGATHIPTRVDEARRRSTPPPPTTPRTAIFELEGGHRRADQLVLGGPGVPRRAGRVPGRRHRGQRGRRPAQLPDPAPGRDPEAGLEPGPAGHRGLPRRSGSEVPDNEEFDNGFKVQWEAFLRHVVDDAPFPWDFAGRRARRAAGRAGPAVGARGPPRRGAGAAR